MTKLDKKVDEIIAMLPSFNKMLYLGSMPVPGKFVLKSKLVDIEIIEFHKGTKTTCKMLDGTRYTSMVYNVKHYNEELRAIRNRIYKDIENYLKNKQKVGK